MIFIIRLITATCFFALLGKANIWLNPVSNIILAVGYRSFLIFSPFFSKITKQFAIGLSLLLATLGILLFCGHGNIFLISGSLLLGIGVSISSYLIRMEAAETPKGAAHNKIAANLGGIVSGLILLGTFGSKNLFYELIALAFFVSCLLAFSISHKKKNISLRLPETINFKYAIGWLLLGLATGIKLFGVFSVLPQFLILKQGQLPIWYGFLIFTNAFFIVFLQLPIIHCIEKFNQNNHGIKITLITMLIGMLLIAFPAIFCVTHLIGAVLWTISLSFVECVASYLDVQGSRSGFLLIKEAAVGIGGGLTVLVCRSIAQSYSSELIGLIGIASIIFAYILLNKTFISNR